MLTWSLVIGLWLVLTCSVSFALLDSPNPVSGNLLVTGLIFFNCLNVFIAVCEICLGYHIKFIQADYQALRKKHKIGQEWDGAVALLGKRVSVVDVFDGRTWALMWSTYALFDTSYQNPESFGFWIDVGNGWTTIPSCLLLQYAILRPDEVSPLLVGCVTIASYWQMLYGTIVYFLSFVFNRRYAGRPLVSTFLFVVTINAVWLFLPALAIYAAVCILRDGNMSVLKI